MRRLILLVLSFLMIAPVLSSAQGNGSAPALPPSNGTLASVSISNLHIVSRKDNVFTLGFDVIGGQTVEPQVLYAISLLDQKGITTADQKVYTDDAFSVGAGQTIHKTITYTALPFFSGLYVLRIDIKTSDGLALGFVQTPPILFKEIGQGLSIDASKCFLTIKEDPKSLHININEGDDFKKEETVIAHCSIKNNFSSGGRFIPVFETHYRTSFGKIVGTEREASVITSPGKVLEFSGIVPKMSEPQAYTVNLFFVDGSGKQVSSSVSFHYVLRGESATIQNVTLDKDYYAKGETAHLALLWSGSADSFIDSRFGATELTGGASLFVSLVDGNKQPCIADVTKAIDPNTSSILEQLPLPITAECLNPSLTVKITDGSGKILASNSYSITSKNPPKTPKFNFSLLFSLGVVVLALILVLYFYLMKKKDGAMMVKVFLGLVLLSSLFVSGGTAWAASATEVFKFHVDGGSPQTSSQAITYTFNLDKTVYAEGEPVTIYGDSNSTLCQNSVGGKMRGWLYSMSGSNGPIGGQIGIYDTVLTPFPRPWDWNHYTYVPQYTSGSFAAPTTPGDYVVQVVTYLKTYSKYRWVSAELTAPYLPLFQGSGKCTLNNAGAPNSPCGEAEISQGGGSNHSLYFTVAAPVPGVPGGGAGGAGTCTSGTLRPGSDNGQTTCNTTRTWYCDGTYGGAGSSGSYYNGDCATPPPGGYLDGVSCSTISGWTCEPNHYDWTLYVHLYKDGPAGGGGTFVTANTAGDSRPDVAPVCGGYPMHGFNIPTPASLKDGVTHSIYTYAIANPPGTNPLLNNAPKTLGPCAPDVTGVCGQASQSSPYPATATSYTGNYCSSGNPSTSAPFPPNPGDSSSWTCLGSGSGSDSGTCTATRLPITPPNAPSISADPGNSGYVNEPQTFSFVADDTNSPKISVRYGVDWDNDDTVDVWTPWVSSGASQSLSYQWITPGSGIAFKARTQNYGLSGNGPLSGWTSKTISLATRPIPATCGPAATTYPPSASGYTGKYCSPDTAPVVPTTPPFPAQGSSVTWTCSSPNGGLGASCSATHSSECGSSTNIPLLTKPANNLCYDGSHPSVSVVGSNWTWTCGTTSCTAPKRTITFIPF